MALIARVRRRLDIEEQRRQPLNTERSPVSRWLAIDVAAQACLQIPKSRDRARIEKLMAAVIERAVVAQEALRFDPQLVGVGADPSLAVPAEFWPAAATDAGLELI